MGSSGLPEGFQHLPGYFDEAAQSALLAEVFEAVLAAPAPFYRPHMPRTGKPLSVLMTNLGSLGWMTDKDKGYRYEPHHPQTGRPWPPMPQALLDLWDAVADYPAPPEACLVNWYSPSAKMGQHVDWDEEATDAAVVSISLGDEARFRVGGPQRGGKTASLRLASGDVVVLGGASRRSYHGVDRIYAGTSKLLQNVHTELWSRAGLPGPHEETGETDQGDLLAKPQSNGAPPNPAPHGRINLTLRRVTIPQG